MRTYCLKRSLALIPTLFVISVILFTLVKMMPGDPVAMMMDPHTKPELYAASYAVKKEELDTMTPSLYSISVIWNIF